mmetsp:Transcript_40949/g.119619  ORF Transcript_40949/g.119619 Transcript_40949/m.119619 type:complete len:112 (+) Transcript_40949:1127-1462(+)
MVVARAPCAACARFAVPQIVPPLLPRPPLLARDVQVTTMSMCPLDNNIIAFGVPVVPVEDGVANLIELVNFAQSARIQTLRTCHQLPMVELDYSPDSEQAAAHPQFRSVPV